MNSSKRQQFRHSIRRKQMDQIFAHQRKICFEKAITQQHLELQQLLKTQQKKKQWITEKALHFRGQPAQVWVNHLRDLSLAVRFYQSNFEMWLKAGIIQILVLLIKRQIDDQITEMAAIVLGEVFYYLPEQSKIIDKILQFQFILELSELCSPSIQNAGQYYHLIIQMISHRHYIRDKFIDNGIVQNLTTRLKTIEDYQSDETFKAFGLIFRLLRIYQKNNFSLPPKRNVCSIFIPVIEQYLVSTHRKDIIQMCLKCILQLAQLNNASIYSLIANSHYILKAVLHNLCLQQAPHIRALCAGILTNYLCSPNINHAKQLSYLGFLDKINECIKIENTNKFSQNQNKGTNMTIKLLLALQNFAANSVQQLSALFMHPVFQFVIQMSHQSQPLKVKYEAIYIFGTIISSGQFNIIDKLVNDYKILEILVLNLNAPSQSFVCEILTNLIKLIVYYDKIFTGKMNKIIDILQRFYNIDMVLKQLQDQCCNKNINKKIELLVAKLNGE